MSVGDAKNKIDRAIEFVRPLVAARDALNELADLEARAAKAAADKKKAEDELAVAVHTLADTEQAIAAARGKRQSEEIETNAFVMQAKARVKSANEDAAKAEADAEKRIAAANYEVNVVLADIEGETAAAEAKLATAKKAHADFLTSVNSGASNGAG